MLLRLLLFQRFGFLLFAYGSHGLVGLDAVDELYEAIDHHAPADDEEGCCERVHGLQHDEHGDGKDEGGHEPIEPPYATHAARSEEADELVDGAEDDHGCQRIHEARDERGGHEGEDDAQEHATDAHEGERLGRETRHETRHEEQCSDGDGQPMGGLLTELDKERTHNNGDDGAHDETLDYSHGNIDATLYDK